MYRKTFLLGLVLFSFCSVSCSSTYMARTGLEQLPIGLSRADYNKQWREEHKGEIGVSPKYRHSFKEDGSKWDVFVYEVYQDTSVPKGRPALSHYEFAAFRDKTLYATGEGIPQVVQQAIKERQEMTTAILAGLAGVALAFAGTYADAYSSSAPAYSAPSTYQAASAYDEPAPAYASTYRYSTGAPKIYAKDGTYLGRLSSNPYDAESISNPYGKYGSKYSSTSVNNPYSKYGSEYSSQGARNPYSTQGADIVASDGTYLGELNSNSYDAESVSNPYGQYGSPYSSTSINNPYSTYGSPYSSQSATNPYVTR